MSILPIDIFHYFYYNKFKYAMARGPARHRGGRTLQISTRGRYAVRIMLDVARYGGETPIRSADIAERQGLSPKYTEQITAMLAKGGLLHAARGAGGGYTLLRSPEDYNIAEILLYTEGELVPVNCRTEIENGDSGENDAVRRLWVGLHEQVIDYLGNYTLRMLLDSVYDAGDHYVI